MTTRRSSSSPPRAIPGIAELGECVPIDALDIERARARSRASEPSISPSSAPRRRSRPGSSTVSRRGAADLRARRAPRPRSRRRRRSPRSSCSTRASRPRAPRSTRESPTRKAAARRFGAPSSIKASGSPPARASSSARRSATPTARSTTCSRATASAHAGAEVLVEEFMEGEELSLFALTDGTHVRRPPRAAGSQAPARRRRRAPTPAAWAPTLPVQLGYDADRSLSAEPDAADELVLEAARDVFGPTLRGLAARGRTVHRAALRWPHAHADGRRSSSSTAGSAIPRRRRCCPCSTSRRDCSTCCSPSAEASRSGYPVPTQRTRPARTSSRISTVERTARASRPSSPRPTIPRRRARATRSRCRRAEDGVFVFHAGTARDADGHARHRRRTRARRHRRRAETFELRAARAAWSSPSACEFDGKQYRADIGWREIARQVQRPCPSYLKPRRSRAISIARSPAARITDGRVTRPDVLREVTPAELRDARRRRDDRAVLAPREARRARSRRPAIASSCSRASPARCCSTAARCPSTSAATRRVRFALDDGRDLHYRDIRRLGTVALMTRRASRSTPRRSASSHLTRRSPRAHLSGILRGSRQAVKKVLMDHASLVGVGNIYANEALWRAGIDPSRAAATRRRRRGRRAARRHRRRAHRVDRRARHELPRLSRRVRRARRLRALARRRTAAAASPACAAAPPRRDARDRRTIDGALRALSTVRAAPRRRRPTRSSPTMRAHVRARRRKDRPGVYRMLVGRRRGRVRRQVEAGAHAAAELLPLRVPGGQGRAHPARGDAHRVGVHAERVRRAARGAAAHQALPPALQRRDEARRAALRVHQAHARRRRRSCSSCAAPAPTTRRSTTARSTARSASARRCAS